MILPQLIATLPIILEFLGDFDLYFVSNQKDVHKLLQISKTWRNYLIPYIIPKLQFCTMCKLSVNVLEFVRHLIDVTQLFVPDWLSKIAGNIKTLTLTYPCANLDGFVNLDKISVSKSSHHTCFVYNGNICEYNCFDKNNKLFTFPKKLKHILFECSYFVFPDSIFSNLPNSLKTLSVPHSFNSPLTNLPSTLYRLTLSKNFNQPLILPPKLRILYFGGKFNQPITLVPSLRFLRFGEDFNQPIKLLNGLKRLHLPRNYTHDVLFPTTLTSLCFRGGHVSPNFNHLTNLKHLYLSETFGHTWTSLPQTLEKLDIFDFDFNLPLGCLSNRLKKLCLSYTGFNHSLGILPSTLQVLELGDKFDHPLGILPNTLQVLKLGNDFNHPLGKLPNSLQKLQFGNKFQCMITNLPKSLNKLIVGKLFVSQMELLLPCILPIHLQIYSNGKIVIRSRVVTRSMNKRQKI
jgi:hypothetical protein